jgi:hypothetical protein
MKNWVYDNEEYIRIAFNRLESEFTDPNNFDLDAFSVRKKDTVVTGILTLLTIFTLYIFESRYNQ